MGFKFTKLRIPEIVINCAAYNAVDQAEDNKDIAQLVNYDAVKNLAGICFYVFLLKI